MVFFKYFPHADILRPLSASDADKNRHTDAGVTTREFIIQAPTATSALDGARRWCACWADDDQSCVPDDLALEEREYRPGKTYMTLRVL